MDVGTYGTVPGPSGVSVHMWKEGAGMQSGAGSECNSHRHLPGSRRCLLVARVVPRTQYRGEGRREGPGGMKEDPSSQGEMETL